MTQASKLIGWFFLKLKIGRALAFENSEFCYTFKKLRLSKFRVTTFFFIEYFLQHTFDLFDLFISFFY